MKLRYPFNQSEPFQKQRHEESLFFVALLFVRKAAEGA